MSGLVGLQAVSGPPPAKTLTMAYDADSVLIIGITMVETKKTLRQIGWVEVRDLPIERLAQLIAPGQIPQRSFVMKIGVPNTNGRPYERDGHIRETIHFLLKHTLSRLNPEGQRCCGYKEYNVQIR